MKTLYGLPEEIVFCKNCVISNQRPNSAVEFLHKPDSKKKTIHFDEHGICDACRVAQLKHNDVNWKQREEELVALLDAHRGKYGKYDCIVPGSGGKDSFYASHRLKYRYGMSPLTVTWAPHMYTPWGWNNFQSWIHAGFDNILFTPNGKVHRLLTRLAVDKLFHPFQPFMIGQKLFAVKMALQTGIPLIFYGENEAEYGNPLSDALKAKRSESYVSGIKEEELFISGVALSELKSKYELSDHDLAPYIPVSRESYASQQLEVHYLGYYLKWHPQGSYYYAVEHGQFQASPERTPGTYSKYNSIDDKIDDMHYFTTFIKFGIGRATYDASQEIRSGEITRDEGVALVKKFDGEWPARFEKEIFEYLSISEKDFGAVSKQFETPIMNKDSFLALADQFRSPHLWHKEANEWQLTKQVESLS